MKKSLKIILFIQLLMVITTILDVLVIRQISGFICLSFIPGYLVIKILRIDFKKKIDVFIFSFGMSIGYLMLIGLLMNELYPLLGIIQPLSVIPVLLTLSFVNIVFIFINNKQNFESSEKSFNFEFKNNVSYFLVFLLPPLSGIIGAIYKNNSFLIFMIFLISVFFLILAFKEKYIPKNMYPYLIYSISIALLLHTSLISSYLIGDDIHIEYQVFKITKMNSIWDPAYFRNENIWRGLNNVNAMLSSTIFPTIYSIIINIKADIFLKIVSPFILSIIPIILYRFYEREFNYKIAIYSVFFFISDPTTFFGVNPISLNRQIIAQLFFVLSILVLFYDEIDNRKRQFLFLFFGVMVMVSHYASSYVYFYYLVFLYIFLRKNNKNRILNSTSLILLTMVKLSWDVYISIYNVYQINRGIIQLYNRFIIDFFNPLTRPQEIEQLISTSGTIITQLHKLVFYAVNFLLLLGFIEVFRKRKTLYIEKKYKILMTFAILNIILVVFIPNIVIFNFYRFRIFAMLILAPLIVIGGKSIFDWMNRVLVKRRLHIQKSDFSIKLVSLILVAYFLFNVGFVNHIMGDKPIAVSLDIDRLKTSNVPQIKIDFYTYYIPEQDFYSTTWLSNYVKDNPIIYADHISSWHVLHSYGMFSSDKLYPLLNNTQIQKGDYIYLNYLNFVEGIITRSDSAYLTSEISPLLNENNKVYSNGDSEVYSGY